jgi:Flp pilus assembly protein TadG
MGIHRERSERGAAAVEFALVMPLLLLLVFGIVEFGLIMNRQITVTHAAREGARYYSLPGITGAQAKARCEAAAPNFQTSADPQQNVVCTATPTTTAGAPGTTVTMKAEVFYKLRLYFIKRDVDLVSTAVMSRE